jgi:hypothetical protein
MFDKEEQSHKITHKYLCLTHVSRQQQFGLVQRTSLSGIYHLAQIKRAPLRVALHPEVGPIPLEADCMKFQPLLGWRPASTTHYIRL